MVRECESCGEAFVAKREAARFCSDRCRKRSARRRPVLVPAEERAAAEDALESIESCFSMTRRELEKADGVSSSAGQAALKLALLIDLATPLGSSSVPAMVKELRATMAEATRSRKQSTSLVDELRLRREQRANAS